MSELIELLKRKNNLKTQERLAQVYFPSSIYNNNERAGLSREQTKRVAAMSLIVLSLLIVAGILFYVFSAHNITIDITINKKVRPIFENLLSRGDISLAGSAFNKKNRVFLKNSGKRGSDAVIIDLKEPVDLSRMQLLLALISRQGSADLKVVLRDENYRSAASGPIEINSREGEIKNFTVSAEDYNRPVDIQRIRHIRLQYADDQKNARGDSEIEIRSVALINNQGG